jgi:hypothetical protein
VLLHDDNRGHDVREGRLQKLGTIDEDSDAHIYEWHYDMRPGDV